MARWGLVFTVLSTQTGVLGSPPAELDRLIAEALARNADVAEAREMADAARQRVRPAAALPDPMISLSYENDGFEPSLGTQEMTRLELMVQQAIPFPGKQRLAGQIAGAEAEEVESRVARVRLTVEASVRRAYADLLLARQYRGLVDEQIGAFQGIEELTRNRYSVGMGSQQDVLRAQSERTRLEQQRVRDEAAERMALTELSRLLQRTVETAEIAGHPLTREALPPPLSREEAQRLAAETSPELGQLRTSQGRAKLVADLARRNLRPDFVASASYMNRGGMPLMWSLGLGVSVPVWARQKQAPLIVEAESRIRAAAAAEVSLRTRLQGKTDERLIRLEQLVREAALDADGILLQDRLSVDAALASYRAGGVPFVAVLEALSTLFIDRRTAVSRLAAYLKTDADLRELSPDGGVGPSPAGGGPAPLSTSSASGM